MNRLQIFNIGPIKSVDVELNKINILMGPQSSGKSTIAKIISFCQWAEKRFLLDGEFEYDVFEQLLEFHRLSDNYFIETSLFSYETDFVKISYRGKKLKKSFRKKRTSKIYKKSKNIYIPSERNFVSVIPNLSKYKETNDNIMSFVYDWFTSKRVFEHNNSLNILNLGIKFYNHPESDNEILILDNKKEILLREGSSGLQSVIPLIVNIEYLTSYIFKKNISNSVDEKDSLNKFLADNISKLIDLEKYSSKTLNNVESFKLDENDLRKLLNSYQRVQGLESYFSTNFIIEEPEQNLFPSTQRHLINYLFNKMNDSRDHNLILTTHSPYILYSINNCLMGFNIKDEYAEENPDQSEIINSQSWLNPDLVSIWQVNHGELKSVKDENTKTVTKHYFNEITKDIMDEYFEMLSYYDPKI